MQADKKSEKIIIKVGTATLNHPDASKAIDIKLVERLIKVISKLRKENHKVVFVTSGAVALGVKKLNLQRRPKTILEKQVAAAVGQALLMQLYEKHFSKHKISIAQILLTRDGFSQREAYLNARETILELLKLNILPIINENDVVANEEIKFSDNDMLSAMVSDLISADRLIILTDERGLYDKNPKTYKSAKLIELVKEITPEVEKMASGRGSQFSLGGMITKIQAAKLTTSVGIPTFVIYGKEPEKVFDLLEGKPVGTTFLPSTNKTEKRKSWIKNTLVINGKIYVDSGAQKAILANGKSLLPAGIKKIGGNFNRGAGVEIFLTDSNKPFAKGISNYSKTELEKIAGLKSVEIEKILGYTYGETVVHRDDLVILNN